MARTRRYSVEIKDDKGRSLLFAMADWILAAELRTAIAPADASLTAPDGEETEDR